MHSESKQASMWHNTSSPAIAAMRGAHETKRGRPARPRSASTHRQGKRGVTHERHREQGPARGQGIAVDTSTYTHPNHASTYMIIMFVALGNSRHVLYPSL